MRGGFKGGGSLWVTGGGVGESGGALNGGDIKQSFVTKDHDGWVLLDGRAISTLNEAQKTVATGLGFLTNLPDASDRFIIGAGANYSLKSTGGSTNIARSSLPNFTLSGDTTDTNTAHTHSGSSLSAVTANATHSHASGTLATSAAGSHNHAYNMSNGAIAVDGTQQTVSVSQVNTTANTSTTSDHTHLITGSTANDTAAHSHTISGNTGAMSANETHKHSYTTASINGNVTQTAHLPPYLALNTFIYLGA